MIVDNFGGTENHATRTYWSKVLKTLSSEYAATYSDPLSITEYDAYRKWMKETWGITLLDGITQFGVSGVEIDDKYMTMLLLRVPA